MTHPLSLVIENALERAPTETRAERALRLSGQCMCPRKGPMPQAIAVERCMQVASTSFDACIEARCMQACAVDRYQSDFVEIRRDLSQKKGAPQMANANPMKSMAKYKKRLEALHGT